MTRPLGQFSGFVVEQLQGLVAQGGEQLQRGVERALKGLSDQHVSDMIGTEGQIVAALDLKMTEVGLLVTGQRVPERLSLLIDQVSGPCGGLTYEEVVLANPVADLRLFTTGELGSTERFFIDAHRQIEEILARVIRRLENIFEAIRNDEPVTRLSFREWLDEIMSLTGSLAQMPEGHFAQIRRFYAPHPTRDTKGPSGAFSARFYALELLVRGDALSENFLSYIQDNRMYFPQCDIVLLERALRAVEEGETLNIFATHEHAQLVLPAHLERLTAFFTQFRKAHMAAVRRQTPEVLEGVQGTGGEDDVRTFLESRMNMGRS